MTCTRCQGLMLEEHLIDMEGAMGRCGALVGAVVIVGIEMTPSCNIIVSCMPNQES